jgi:hypothetical protein
VALGAVTGCTTLLGDFQDGNATSNKDGGGDATTGDDGSVDARMDTVSPEAAPTCTPGGACSTECASGVNACSDGGLVCHTTANSPDGTQCGTGSTGMCTSGVCTCPTGQAFCSSTCVATANDDSNCGFCGHTCGAGSTCSTGFCTPVSVCTGAGSGPMWAVGTNLVLIEFNALDLCDLTATGAAATQYYRDPLNGLSFTSLSGDSTIAYFTSHDVTVDTNSLLSTDGTEANTFDVEGYPSVYASTYVTTTTDSKTGSVFTALQTSVELQELSQATDAGIPSRTCIDNIGSLRGIAAAGGDVFVADGTGNEIITATATSDTSCSSSTITAEGLSSPGELATDGTIIAFADSNGIYSCTASLGCIPRMSPTPLVTGQGAITQIAIDQVTPPNLYWIGPMGIATCSSSATICDNKPNVLIPNASDADAVMVDSTYVYYLEGGILYKVAK